jgi:hypothetical protein
MLRHKLFYIHNILKVQIINQTTIRLLIINGVVALVNVIVIDVFQ